MGKQKVVITDCDLPGAAAEEMLRAAGMHAERADCRSADDVIAAADGAVALIVQWAPITADVFAHADALRVISRLGIGCDMVDIDAATRHGVAVANTPAYCIEEVAAHTVAMILALSRGLIGYDRAVRAGAWVPTHAVPMAVRPSQTTVSVVGFGRIGELTARQCAALGYQVVVHDPFVARNRIAEIGAEAVGMEEALARADVLTLHAPLTPDTQHLINAKSVRLMKPGAALVNTCRGPLVDATALVDALNSGHLSGAALDVFEHEPLPPGDILFSAKNVILTPHAAWYSPHALDALPVHAANNVVNFLQNRPVSSIINQDYATSVRA